MIGSNLVQNLRSLEQLPPNWQVKEFANVISDVSGGNAKIPKSDFQENGKFAIVDQGKELIAGYWDDASAINKEKPPLIVFGDHTRIVKYIDFTFVMGADGVKVLKSKYPEENDTKYLYYYFKSLAIPNTGYNRHYKYLKSIKIPLPPLEEQQQIAAILDAADELRQKDQALIAKYDELTQALFLDMFGDPVTNPMGWQKVTIRDMVSEAKYGTSSKASELGKYPYLRMNNITYEGYMDYSDLKYIDIPEKDKHKYLVQQGDVLFNRTNSKELVGKTGIVELDSEMIIAGYLIRLRTNHDSNPYYIWGHLNSKWAKLTLRNMCKNIVGMANINAQELQNIVILQAPITIQNQYASIVKEIESQKAFAQQSLKKSEELFNSLLQKAFKGELTEGKRKKD